MFSLIFSFVAVRSWFILKISLFIICKTNYLKSRINKIISLSRNVKSIKLYGIIWLPLFHFQAVWFLWQFHLYSISKSAHPNSPKRKTNALLFLNYKPVKHLHTTVLKRSFLMGYYRQRKVASYTNTYITNGLQIKLKHNSSKSRHMYYVHEII